MQPEPLPGRGKLDVVAVAGKQGDTKVFLELPNAHADRRLGDMQHFTGPPKVSQPGYFQKSAQ